MQTTRNAISTKEFIIEEDEGSSAAPAQRSWAGSYKVFARRWDGSLLPAYYVEGSASGASKFDEATTLTLSADEIIVPKVLHSSLPRSRLVSSHSRFRILAIAPVSG